MRRFNKDKGHREGYEWLRLQESKSLCFFSTFSLFSLTTPFLIDLSINLTTYIAHALLSGVIIRYSLAKVCVIAEDDGIYLKTNRKESVKIKDWEEGNVTLISIKSDKMFMLERNTICILGKDNQIKIVHEAHCQYLYKFINSICLELSDLHQRRRDQNIN